MPTGMGPCRVGLQPPSPRRRAAGLPFAAGLVVAAGLSTALVPRVGPRLPMTLGLLVGAGGLAWLTQIGVDTSYRTHVLPPELLMSFGLGLAFPALSSTALVKVAGPRTRGWPAPVNTTQQVGGSLGTALLNTVAASATASFIVVHGRGSVAAGTVHGFAVAFALGAGFLALGALVSPVFVTAHGDDLAVPTIGRYGA